MRTAFAFAALLVLAACAETAAYDGDRVTYTKISELDGTPVPR